MGRKKENTIEDTGIMSGGIAIGNGNANKGLKIRVLFDWDPSKNVKSRPGGPIPGPFELLEGGTGVSRTRDGQKHNCGEIFEKVRAKQTAFEDADDFFEEVRKIAPEAKAKNAINANTMTILEGKPYAAAPRATGATTLPERKELPGEIPSKQWIEELIESLIREGRGTAKGSVNQAALKEAILEQYYRPRGKNPPAGWWEKIIATAKRS